MEPRRFRLIAMVLAVAAIALAGTSAVVVARRSAPVAEVAVHPVRAAPPQDRTVAAKDIALGGTSPIIPTAAPPDDPVVPVLAGLTKLDDEHFTVTHAAFDAFLADRDRVLRGARIVPAVHLGQSDGFKFYAIKPTSLFAHLGLQNGDLLRELNGVAVVDRGVLDDLRDTPQFLFELERRGDPFELTITVK